MSKNKIITTSFISAIGWIFLNTFFGLMSIWICIFISSFNKNIIISKSIILEDGLLLFFCISLVGAVYSDYILIGNKSNTMMKVMNLIPLVLIIFSTIIFIELYFHKNVINDLRTLLMYQNLIIFLTFIYCLVNKTILNVWEISKKIEIKNKNS